MWSLAGKFLFCFLAELTVTRLVVQSSLAVLLRSSESLRVLRERIFRLGWSMQVLFDFEIYFSFLLAPNSEIRAYSYNDVGVLIELSLVRFGRLRRSLLDFSRAGGVVGLRLEERERVPDSFVLFILYFGISRLE